MHLQGVLSGTARSLVDLQVVQCGPRMETLAAPLGRHQELSVPLGLGERRLSNVETTASFEEVEKVSGMILRWKQDSFMLDLA